jgi:hypothetical protein
MRYCQTCQRTYADDTLHFCPHDESELLWLQTPAASDSEATLIVPKFSDPPTQVVPLSLPTTPNSSGSGTGWKIATLVLGFILLGSLGVGLLWFFRQPQPSLSTEQANATTEQANNSPKITTAPPPSKRPAPDNLASNKLPGTISNIRQTDFRNFTYKVWDKNIKVKNGDWEIKNPLENRKYDGGLYYFSVAQVLFGDLTSDGQEEALIIATFGFNYGGTGYNSGGYGFYIYSIKEGTLQELPCKTALEDLYSPYALENGCEDRFMGAEAKDISGGVITFEGSLFGPSCGGPTITMKARLEGGRLVLVSQPIKRMSTNQ